MNFSEFDTVDIEEKVRRLEERISKFEQTIGSVERVLRDHQHGGIDGSELMFNTPIKLGTGNFVQIGKYFIRDTDVNEDFNLWFENGDLYYRGGSTGTNDVLINTPFIGGRSNEQDVTIASGSITPTSGLILIETEGAAATDDLATITTTGINDGSVVILMANSSFRTVVVKDGTGNLKLAGDCSLDNNDDTITLVKYGGSWYEVARSNNGT